MTINALQLINGVRFSVIGVQCGVVLISSNIFQLTLPLFQLIVISCVWAIIACLFWLSMRNKALHVPVITSQLILDIMFFTLFLYFSGGSTNPFTSIYMVWVVMGALLLPTSVALLVFSLTIVGYVVIFRHHHPLLILSTQQGETLHIMGMLLSFILGAGITLGFVIMMAKIIRDQKEKVSKEKSYADMGLLAAASAHELSTPLSTIAMVIDELKHDNPSPLLESCSTQINLLQTSVKELLTILGSNKFEKAEKKQVSTYYQRLIHDLNSQVTYDDRFTDPMTMTPSLEVDKVVRNVIENAVNASVSYVGCVLELRDDALLFHITDDGPGMSSELFERVTQRDIQPHQGFGLYISTIILDRINGSLAISRENHQTTVTIKIPKDVLCLAV